MIILPWLLGLTCSEVCTERQGLTIYNNCGEDYKVFRNGVLVPHRCLDGLFCDDYLDDNPTFYVKKFTDRSIQGMTLAEFYFPRSGPYWGDISLVAGYNVGVEIKYDGQTLKQLTRCVDPNCPDAYDLCDIAVTNLFNPVYRYESGGSMEITFCPDGENTQPLNGHRHRAVDYDVLPITCRVKLPVDDIRVEGDIFDEGAILND